MNSEKVAFSFSITLIALSDMFLTTQKSKPQSISFFLQVIGEGWQLIQAALNIQRIIGECPACEMQSLSIVKLVCGFIVVPSASLVQKGPSLQANNSMDLFLSKKSCSIYSITHLSCSTRLGKRMAKDCIDSLIYLFSALIVSIQSLDYSRNSAVSAFSLFLLRMKPSCSASTLDFISSRSNWKESILSSCFTLSCSCSDLNWSISLSFWMNMPLYSSLNLNSRSTSLSLKVSSISSFLAN